MERSNISGMTVEEYREWMKESLDDIYLKNESDPIDEIVENMSEKELRVTSVNKNELKDVVI